MTSAFSIVELASGLHFPEGPVAMPDGSVILVEIAGGRLTRVAADGTLSTIAELGGGPNGAAMGPDGRIYVCNNGGLLWTGKDDPNGVRATGIPKTYSGGWIEAVDIQTGAVEILYRECNGNRLCAPNDLVFDGLGGFYFTDYGKSYDRHIDRGAVYYALADGSMIREVIFPILMPNGCGLSADGKTLYVSETDTARLWAFDLVAPGTFSPQPFPSPHGGKLIAGLPGYCRFDSLALDCEGNICVATLVDGSITILSPEGGQHRRVGMPERWVTNICFGGPNLRTAYVTLGSSGRLVSLQWERAGQPLHHLNK